ncbi:MAG: hypothetical protein QXU82_02860 [Candidatus Aenigmatarchaeota archaeon]
MAKRRKAAKKRNKRSAIWDIAAGIIVLLSVLLLTASAFSSSIDAVVVLGLFVVAVCFMAIYAGKGSLD